MKNLVLCHPGTGKEARLKSFLLWSWRRKELPVAVPPASEAMSREAEHSHFSLLLVLPTPPAPIGRGSNDEPLFVELEKKGTACGRSASERGDEP
ncbi:MAG: hypothetical protein J5526_09085, partial [Bacteroidales bacterium]|nr:hypothetical protein [Bacteroidales bacterium]